MPSSFTTKLKGLSNVLRNEVGVTRATPKTRIADSDLRKFLAIYDTGATNSVVTQKVVDECGLQQTGVTEVNTAAGPSRCETYYVTICLPNRVCFPYLQVTKGNLRAPADILIGMDIMHRGDFAVTNYNNQTVFSFRVPSCECIDFVKQKQPPAVTQPKIRRNDPCPCGSGKKYKNCCGALT
jgi:predicted aspartyl protease